MEAQPLILPGVPNGPRSKRCHGAPSMADVVRGVDAHDGFRIWQVTLGTPIQGSGAIDYHNHQRQMGLSQLGCDRPEDSP